MAQTSDEPWEESGAGLGPENSYVISIDTDSVVIPPVSYTHLDVYKRQSSDL